MSSETPVKREPDVKKEKRFSHNVVQPVKIRSTRNHFVMPKIGVPQHALPEVVYFCRRMGKPLSRGSLPEIKNIFFFRHMTGSSEAFIDCTDHPKWRHMLYSAKTNKLRLLTTKDWDAISGGSATKDFDMDAKVRIRSNSDDMAPLYSAQYLASHAQRRERVKKSRTGKAKRTKKRKRTNAPSSPLTGPGPTDDQKDALKRAKTMSKADILDDEPLWGTLTKEQMRNVLAAAPVTEGEQ